MPVARYSGDPIPVIVVAPSGKEIARREAPFQAETGVEFVAPETGIFRIQANPGLNYLQVASSSHPLSLSAEEGPITVATHQFEVKLLQPSRGQIWGLRLARPIQILMEGHYVDLRGIPRCWPPPGTRC